VEADGQTKRTAEARGSSREVNSLQNALTRPPWMQHPVAVETRRSMLLRKAALLRRLYNTVSAP